MEPSVARSDFFTTPSSTSETTSPIASGTMSPPTAGPPRSPSPAPSSLATPERREPSAARSDFSTTPSSTSERTSPIASGTMSPPTVGSPMSPSPALSNQSALEDVRQTRIFVISDTHSLPWSVPQGHFDFVVCLGDHTDRSTQQEFDEFVRRVLQIDTDHVFLIFGNHEYSTDPDLPKSEYPKFPGARLQHWENHLTKDYALQLCREHGIILLDEGRHEFHLNNGTTAKLYASPHTPKRRKSPYNGYRYKRREPNGQFGHEFNIGPDIDLVFTHGPPEGILDDSGTKPSFRGCKDLLGAVAAARPRLHCFGHNHAGWGATIVDWVKETGDRQLLENRLAKECAPALELNKATKIELVEGKDLASLKQKAAESSDRIGCCRLSHSSQDQHPIQKGSTTLFVNAAYEGITSNSEGNKDTHMPMIVELDLPLTVDSVAEENGIRALLKKSPTSQNTLVPGRTLISGQPGSWMPPHRRQNSLDQATSAMQTMRLSDATATRTMPPSRISSPSKEESHIESDANENGKTVPEPQQHSRQSRPESKTTLHRSSKGRRSPIEMVAFEEKRTGAWGVVGTEKHKYRPCDGSRVTSSNDSRAGKMSKPSTSSSRPGLGTEASRLGDSQVASNQNNSTVTVESLEQRNEGQPKAESVRPVGRGWRDKGAEPEIKSGKRPDRPKKTGQRGAYGFSKSKTSQEPRAFERQWKGKAPAERKKSPKVN